MSEYYLGYTGAQLDDAVNRVRSGYILPEGTINIAENKTFNVKEFENAVVNVPVPDNYINSESIITHCTKSATGTFEGSGQTCDKLSLGLAFRPKIILIFATSPITTSNTGSPYEIVTLWRMYNNDYSALGGGCFFVYRNSSTGKTGHSTTNGVSSNADNTITGWGSSTKFASGVTYSWYAWG